MAFASLTGTSNGPKRFATHYGNLFMLAASPDGRLAIASYDGKIRLRSQLRVGVPPQRPEREPPPRVTFSPNGAVLAVVYDDSISVDFLDGRTLAPLPGPNTDGLQFWSSILLQSHGRQTDRSCS